MDRGASNGRWHTASALGPGKANGACRPNAGSQRDLEQGERLAVMSRRNCCHAIAGNDKFELAHMGIDGSEQHALMRGDAGNDQSAGFELIEEGVQRRGEKARMSWLENKVVVGLGFDQSYEVGRLR